MELTPEEREKIYLEEKARLEAEENKEVFVTEERVEEENVKQNNRSLAIVSFVMIAIILIGVVLYIFAMPTSPEKLKARAYVVSQQYVNKQLKAPATAKYPHISEVSVVEGKDGMYSVWGYVDSQNSFGAFIRSEYSCDLKYLGGDKWQNERVSVYNK